MDIKLKLVAAPVTDVDRAKASYERVGFHADHDVTASEDIRFAQLTPPGRRPKSGSRSARTSGPPTTAVVRIGPP
ncbi:hypothetical protein ACFWIB_18050 [Streptomyces sp. NPDC127051]|uniref:hypothetical protein n=1 Tax=Streptomyces sp. NPDC127051 TaxID=3347119 RepID=UPI003669504C